MASAAAIGLVRPRWLPTALFTLVLFTGAVVAVRLYGIAAEGSSHVQLSELRNEGISWLFFVAAMGLHPRRPGQGPAG
jgi:hypothetical protein